MINSVSLLQTIKPKTSMVPVVCSSHYPASMQHVRGTTHFSKQKHHHLTFFSVHKLEMKWNWGNYLENIIEESEKKHFIPSIWRTYWSNINRSHRDQDVVSAGWDMMAHCESTDDGWTMLKPSKEKHNLPNQIEKWIKFRIQECLQ